MPLEQEKVARSALFPVALMALTTVRLPQVVSREAANSTACCRRADPEYVVQDRMTEAGSNRPVGRPAKIRIDDLRADGVDPVRKTGGDCG